jgi:general secretion pathway protein F
MAIFRYRAVDRAGRVESGQRDADSEAALLDWLKARDLLPVKTGVATPPLWSLSLGRKRRLGAARRAILTRELSVLLSAGLKLDQALALLRRSASRPDEAALLGRVLTKVQGGAAFTDALRAEGDNFSADYLAVLRAGEASGSVPAVLERLAVSLDRAHRMRVHLVGQLIYPAILTVAAIISVAVLMTLVVPAFQPLFAEAGRELPPITRALIATASAVRVGGPIVLLASLTTILALGRLERTHPLRRRLDRMALAMPVIGPLLVRLDAARFCRTFGTLIGNGVQLVAALALSRATIGNTLLAFNIDHVANGVKQGSQINTLLRAEPRWPPLMAELCQVGEETGRLGDMLLKLGDIFDEESSQRLERLTTLATPLITLLLGLLVAGVLAGLLATILSVNELAL